MVDIEHLIGDVARKKLNSSLKVLNHLMRVTGILRLTILPKVSEMQGARCGRS